MGSPTALKYIVAGALLAAPLVAFKLMTSVDGWDPVLRTAAGHFYIVSATALTSGAIGAAFMLSVPSLRNTRCVFLALGFVAVALIFATHGLATPGFIMGSGYNEVVGVSAGLSELVGAAFVALSVMPARWLPGRVERWAPWASAAGLVALCTYAVALLTHPALAGHIPDEGPWPAIFAGVTIGLLAFAVWRYWRAWRLTRFPAQFAMVAALVLLAESQVSMYYGTTWHASWWLYHGLMLSAYLVLVAGWGIEGRRAKSLILFSRALALRDELGRVTLLAPQTLEALETAVSNKDVYTRDHMGRVAVYAVAIAREMRLDPLTIELVEAAGRIHDIGKITVPDAVLLKPGKLTPAEFDQMKHHAARGAHIAKASRVLTPVSAIVRHHHERFAGGGYPDGIAGDRIPLAARIVAVADTFDALTSPRVYRGARPLGEALAEMKRVGGTQLDPACVRAFLAWFERERRESVGDGADGDRLILAA
jgi:putative nucleotidyltransferase with HDIG domain